MALQEFLERSVVMYQDTARETLDGLAPDELAYRPGPDAMSIGFIAWHCSRVHDLLIHTAALSTDQLWQRDGWAERFGRGPADPQDLGFGFESEQLARFDVGDGGLVAAYTAATDAATIAHLRGLDDEQLTTTWVASPVGGRFTLASLYQQLIWEMNQHGGQMAYLRGLQRGIEDPHKLSSVWLEARQHS